MLTLNLLIAQDFIGMGLSMMTPGNLAIFKELSHIYSAHYPEFMVKCLVVHPPMIISTIWRILQVQFVTLFKCLNTLQPFAIIFYLTRMTCGEGYASLESNIQDHLLGGRGLFWCAVTNSHLVKQANSGVYIAHGW